MRKYLNNKGFLFLLIIPFFNPTAFKYIPTLSKFYEVIQYWKLLDVLVIVLLYVYCCKFSKIITSIVFFEAVAIFTSIINGVYVQAPFTNALLAIGMSMLTEMAVKCNFEKFRKVYFTICFIAVLANFVLCLIYPAGLPMATLYNNKSNPVYLLSIDNGMIKALIPLLAFGFYPNCKNAYKKKRVTNSLILYLICCIIALCTLGIVASATGKLVGILFVILSVLFLLFPYKRLPNKLILCLIAAFMVIIVILGSSFDIIEKMMALLGRTGTFTGRTTLWRLAVQKILKRPLFGYGYTSGNIAIWGGYFSSHNMFLEIIIHGGLVLLFIFLYILRIAFKILKSVATPYHNIISLAIVSYLIVGLMETGLNEFLFVLLVLAFNSAVTYPRREIIVSHKVNYNNAL